jgi:hypothetical protein
MIKKVLGRNWSKWQIAVRVVPLIVVVIALKVVADRYEWEVMELNALFTSLVAGTIFLISFLVQGVLSDYKESEKIPSDLAGTLRALYDDAETISGSRGLEAAEEFKAYHKELVQLIHNWFYKEVRTAELMEKISGLNRFFVEFDKGGVTPNYVIKMKADQVLLRKTILRIDTIRDTGFVGSAYAIVEAMGIAISLGLVVIKIEPLYAAIFFIALVSFLIAYMLQLIKDLDNPFDYATNGEGNGTEIPLKPLHDLVKELGIGELGKQDG